MIDYEINTNPVTTIWISNSSRETDKTETTLNSYFKILFLNKLVLNLALTKIFP